MYKLGLDVSTRCVGIAVLDKDDNLCHVEHHKFKGKDVSLEDRAEELENKLQELSQKFNPTEYVFIEAPLILYKGNAGQAKTTALLQRFNGMVSYSVRRVYDFDAIPLNSASCRKVLGIKIVKKHGSKPRDRKKPIIDYIAKTYKGTWSYELTKFGNPKAGVDDEADAIVLAKSGLMLTSKE